MSPIEPPATRYLFPDAGVAGLDDMVALGADLAPGTVLSAYRAGMFPMPTLSGELGWWSPLRRGVLPLDGLRVSRSLRRSVDRYSVTIDRSFREVVEACADPSRPHGWITKEIIEAYEVLHDLGWAHSVETRDHDGTLVGGLYGVAIVGLFAGESMFQRSVDASKVALVALVEHIRSSSMTLLDVQWATDHLQSMGAIEIGRDEYITRLRAALDSPGAWRDTLKSGR